MAAVQAASSPAGAKSTSGHSAAFWLNVIAISPSIGSPGSRGIASNSLYRSSPTDAARLAARFRGMP
ncbi:hypothetical protein D3C83_191270 [compost metagenome]